MNQTDLGAAIEAAKGEATEVKTVKVDIFDIPETKAEEYIANREEVAEAAAQVIKPYCVCLLYTSPSPRDMRRSRMPSSA